MWLMALKSIRARCLGGIRVCDGARRASAAAHVADVQQAANHGVDDEEEEDGRLQHVDQLDRDVGDWICIGAAPARMIPNSSAAKQHAHRVGARQQGDGDGVEAHAGGVRGGRLVGDAQQLARSGKPGQQTADGHRDHDEEARAHARVARRLGIRADRPDLETEGGSVQQPAHDEDRGDGDEHAGVAVAPGQDGQRGVADVVVIAADGAALTRSGPVTAHARTDAAM